MIDFTNFHDATKAIFHLLPFAEKPHRKPNFVSASGSRYWKTRDGVYRLSDHWGEAIRSCDWWLFDGETEHDGKALGFCRFCDMRRDIHEEAVYAAEFIDGTFAKIEWQDWQDIDHMQRGYLSEMATRRTRNMMAKKEIVRAVKCVVTPSGQTRQIGKLALTAGLKCRELKGNYGSHDRKQHDCLRRAKTLA